MKRMNAETGEWIHVADGVRIRVTRVKGGRVTIETDATDDVECSGVASQPLIGDNVGQQDVLNRSLSSRA